MYDKETIDLYDNEFVDVNGVKDKPDLAKLNMAGASSGFELDIKMQRAAGKQPKADANVLNSITRELLLKVEPLPQFPYCTDPGRETINAQILESFYAGPDKTGCTNPTGTPPPDPPPGKKAHKPPPQVPDPLYRAWGDAFYSAFPVSDRQDTRTLRGTSCGMHCFTQVVRNLIKEGDSASIYDRMVAELRKKGSDGALLAANNRPVLTSKAGEYVPSLKTILDTAKQNKTTPLWDPDGETFFKFWYPVWVLWWCRLKSDQTWDTPPKGGEPFLNTSGIFMWQGFSGYARARSKSDKTKVPQALADMGLMMAEQTRHGRVAAAVKDIVAALDEGYAVTILRLRPSGHFMLVVGYVEDADGLRFIINDSGQHYIQRMINPFIPHTVADPPEKAKTKGEEPNTIKTVSRVVEQIQGEEAQTTKTVTEADAKIALQKYGYHIATYVEEVADPPKTVVTGKGNNKVTKAVTTYQHKFTWDWQIASEYWNCYWILKWAEGKQQRKTLSFKSAEFKPPEETPKEQPRPKVKSLWFTNDAAKWEPNNWEDISMGPITLVAEFEKVLPGDAETPTLEAGITADFGNKMTIKLTELNSNRLWMRGTLKAEDVGKALGLAAPKGSYVSCDVTQPSSPGGTVTGTYEDSATFEQTMLATGTNGKMLRGARDQGEERAMDCSNENTWAPAANFAFLKAGGAQCIHARLDAKQSPWRLLKYEATYFYHSGHGHSDSDLTFVDGEHGPSADGTKWWTTLRVLIISGCAVLNANDATGPGRKWMTTGASMFLGYAGRAPGDERDPAQPDNKGATANIIQAWVQGCLDGTDPARLWCNINLEAHAKNACAIDCVNQKYFWIEGLDLNPVFRAKPFASVAEMPL